MAYSIKSEVEKMNSASKVKIRLRKSKVKGYSLYFDLHLQGHPRQTETIQGFFLVGTVATKVKDTETLRRVKEVRDRRESSIQANIHGIANNPSKILFLHYYRQLMNTKEGNTLRVWKTAHNHLESFFNGKAISLIAFDKAYILKFIDYLQKSLKPSTINTQVKRINTVFNLAVKEGLLQRNPASGLKLRETPTELQFLAKYELEKLMLNDCPNILLKYAFLFSCHTGLRIGDIELLTWSKIKDDRVFITTQKTDSELMIPLNRMAIELLKQVKIFVSTKANNRIKEKFENDDIVFPLSRSTTKRSRDLKIWATNSKIESADDFHYHMSRHTFATLSFQAGIDIYTLQKLMGHSSIASTQRYAKVLDSQKTSAVSKLDTYLQDISC